MRIAIVYDWMDKWGGVERMLLVLHAMYPDAKFYTSFYDADKASWAKDINVKTSFMQRLPRFIKSSRIFSLPFFPYAFESLNFNEYDLVISVTSTFAKSIITKPETKHICILLTPPRFLWSHTKTYLPGTFARVVAAPILSRMRALDYVAARRPDSIISISKLVAARCKKYYGLDSDIVYPPFDEEYWKLIKKTVKIDKTLPKKYFLVVARLEPYKCVELAIQAFNELKKQLIVVGAGSQQDNLKRLAGPTITFLENVSDERLGTLYTQAQALIMPQEEDFGYTALEAQYFGCPVISYAHSGATETIINGQTGTTFAPQSTPALKDAIEQFTPIAYNIKAQTVAKGPKHVAAFSVLRFKQQLTAIVAHKI